MFFRFQVLIFVLKENGLRSDMNQMGEPNESSFDLRYRQSISTFSEKIRYHKRCDNNKYKNNKSNAKRLKTKS